MSLDFVAFDVETANSQRGSICAIGVTEVRNGLIVAGHSWLVRPPEALNWFDSYNISLHGITPHDVTDAPGFADSLQRLLAIADGRPVVAHNAAFDIGALREACTAEGLPWPEITYGCSLVLSRRILRLVSHRLPIVCNELDIDLPHHHDAGHDAHACAEIVLQLADRQGADDLAGLARAVNVRLGTLTPSRWNGCLHRGNSRGGSHGLGPVLPETRTDADADHPLYGQVMVFTGALAVVRQDAWDAVAARGAIPEKAVTKRTTMLVIGDGFTGDTAAEFQTGKAQQAWKWIQKGHHIEVLNESDLNELLNEETSGSSS